MLFGADSLLLASVARTRVATFFTFLPSFIFILSGGPLIESTRDNIRLAAPLTAISAAVVGVIVSLAVFFAEHVFGMANRGGDYRRRRDRAVAPQGRDDSADQRLCIGRARGILSLDAHRFHHSAWQTDSSP